MPTDIDPESGFRLPLPKREDLDEVGRKFYDRASKPGSRTIVGLRGPAGIRLHSPKTLEHAQGLNEYLRWEAGFSPAVREVAILATAREMDSQFEWAAHEAEALKEGVAPETIEVIRRRQSADGLGETEAVVISLVRQVLRDHKVTAELFARAHALFGSRQLVDLAMLIGMYAQTAVLLSVFDMQLPPGKEPGLPV